MIRVKMSTLLLTLLAAQGALAGPIVSGDGDEVCRVTSAEADSCSVQTISVHRLWQPNDPNGNGAAWISYADTGHLGTTFATAPADGDPATPDVENPLLLVRETLTGIQSGDRLVLDLWADDTALVRLAYGDGVSIFGTPFATLLLPSFTQNVCADGAGGCEPEDRAHLEYTFSAIDLAAAAGQALYLEFTAFQVGPGTSNASNPFGLLYSGWIENGLTASSSTAAVPEPGTLGLLLAGILLLFGRRAAF